MLLYLFQPQRKRVVFICYVNRYLYRPQAAHLLCCLQTIKVHDNLSKKVFVVNSISQGSILNNERKQEIRSHIWQESLHSSARSRGI